MVDIIRYAEDNLAWLVSDADGNAVVIDPGDADAVLAAVSRRGFRLRAVLCTHHHQDHVAGLTGVRAALPGIAVHAHALSAARLEAIPCQDGDTIRIRTLVFDCLATPGHTRDALCFHFAATHLFSGDTLFGCGCGRLFEGTARTMYASLTRIAALPPETLICPGHDYLVDNAGFARQFGRDASLFADRLAHRAAGEEPPARLAVELATNPFLRASDPALINALREQPGARAFDPDDPASVFAELRRLRNDWG